MTQKTAAKPRCDTPFSQKTAFLTLLPMKIIRFDSGFKLDDKNSYWGNPSYQLEPGDPGYVGPLPVSVKTKTKRKPMKTNPFWPRQQGTQITWLQNFLSKLPGYGTTLGLTPAQVASLVADCLWLIYILQAWLPETRSWGKACTDALDEAENGADSVPQTLPVFTPPPLPGAIAPVPATVPVPPGALRRILAAAQQIKDSDNYTDPIGSDLQIIGSEQVKPNLATLAPVLIVKLVSDRVFIDWSWGGLSRDLDGCEIQVDRNDGKGFVLLTVGTASGYSDPAPLPVTPAKWNYRAIYCVANEHVGGWSATASITVAA